MAPHSMVLCMVGTGLLWVGWYGFNAGSALAPDGIAANAFMTTTLATAVASFTWAMLEYALRGKPSLAPNGVRASTTRAVPATSMPRALRASRKSDAATSAGR